MFDRYIPLGNNCEVAFQMRRVLGRDHSGFFNWNITSINSLSSLLRNDFSDILISHNISHSSGDLFYDKSHDFHFHADFTFPDLNEDRMFEQKLIIVKEKFEYFARKFRNLNNVGRVAFFYKTEETENIVANIINLTNFLSRYIDHSKFSLIIAMPFDHVPDIRDQNNIHYRPLARLAPSWDAHDGHVSSWDKIFIEFPHKEGLRLAGY
jgi:hypothetical protein